MNETDILKKIYFVKAGDRIGQFLIFVEFNKEKKMYSALGVPESEVLYIGQNDIEKALAYKALEYVETLPTDVFNECKREFKHREKSK